VKFAKVLGVAAIAFGATTSAHAVSINNGSFESGVAFSDPFITLNATDSTSITGWTVSAGSIDYIGSYWQPADGSRSLDMNGLSTGAISQLLTGLTVGHQYQISFDLAGNTDAGPAVKTLSVAASVSSNSFTFDTTGHSRPAMGWVLESFFFTATNSNELLTFASLVTAGGTEQNPAAFGPALDNVSILDRGDAPGQTPLPAALPLFASGLGVIGLLARRRKRTAAA
jgi:choice-of-anchor C domain-containing protein